MFTDSDDDIFADVSFTDNVDQLFENITGISVKASQLSDNNCGDTVKARTVADASLHQNECSTSNTKDVVSDASFVFINNKSEPDSSVLHKRNPAEQIIGSSALLNESSDFSFRTEDETAQDKQESAVPSYQLKLRLQDHLTVTYLLQTAMNYPFDSLGTLHFSPCFCRVEDNISISSPTQLDPHLVLYFPVNSVHSPNFCVISANNSVSYTEFNSDHIVLSDHCFQLLWSSLSTRNKQNNNNNNNFNFIFILAPYFGQVILHYLSFNLQTSKLSSLGEVSIATITSPVVKTLHMTSGNETRARICLFSASGSLLSIDLSDTSTSVTTQLLNLEVELKSVLKWSDTVILYLLSNGQLYASLIARDLSISDAHCTDKKLCSEISYVNNCLILTFNDGSTERLTSSDIFSFLSKIQNQLYMYTHREDLQEDKALDVLYNQLKNVSQKHAQLCDENDKVDHVLQQLSTMYSLQATDFHDRPKFTMSLSTAFNSVSSNYDLTVKLTNTTGLKFISGDWAFWKGVLSLTYLHVNSCDDKVALNSNLKTILTVNFTLKATSSSSEQLVTFSLDKSVYEAVVLTPLIPLHLHFCLSLVVDSSLTVTSCCLSVLLAKSVLKFNHFLLSKPPELYFGSSVIDSGLLISHSHSKRVKFMLPAEGDLVSKLTATFNSSTQTYYNYHCPVQLSITTNRSSSDKLVCIESDCCLTLINFFLDIIKDRNVQEQSSTVTYTNEHLFSDLEKLKIMNSCWLMLNEMQLTDNVQCYCEFMQDFFSLHLYRFLSMKFCNS